MAGVGREWSLNGNREGRSGAQIEKGMSLTAAPQDMQVSRRVGGGRKAKGSGVNVRTHEVTQGESGRPAFGAGPVTHIDLAAAGD